MKKTDTDTNNNTYPYPVGTLIAWNDAMYKDGMFGIIVNVKRTDEYQYSVKWFRYPDGFPIFGQTTIERCVYDFERLTKR